MSQLAELAALVRDGRPFALLHRPGARPGLAELLAGPVQPLRRLAELDRMPGRVLALVPFCQVAERGFAHPADGTPLLAMRVDRSAAIPVSVLVEEWPVAEARLVDGDFDLSDEEYAALVARVVTEEIGRGEGANFVLRRTFRARVPNFDPGVAVTLFTRLLRMETGAYWTFLVSTPELTLVGASPERHLSMSGGLAVMNPISGTYRYPPSGPDLAGLLAILDDAKESNELYMVLDEELKMMAAVCPDGGRVVGPYLKEMSRLAHTEYLIEGRTDRPATTVLRHTLFAPTVTGSPVENACRVIARHERTPRRYYSGAIALLDTAPGADPVLDSAILIRTAEIDATGRLTLGIGATVVRDSDPLAEAAETRAKAAGLLQAFGSPAGLAQPGVAASAEPRAAAHPEVAAALARRNADLARFWLPGGGRPAIDESLCGRRVDIVDGEDTFIEMLARQIRSCGPEVRICEYGRPVDEKPDLLVLGPGPGDPTALGDVKISAFHQRLAEALAAGVPVLGICLGHQILCDFLGLRLVRRPVPDQGVQRRVNLFGSEVRVGFYSTFTARSETDEVWCPQLATSVRSSRNPTTGEIYGLRGPGLRSFQFHPESVLSTDGFAILNDTVRALLPAPARAGDPA